MLSINTLPTYPHTYYLLYQPTPYSGHYICLFYLLYLPTLHFLPTYCTYYTYSTRRTQILYLLYLLVLAILPTLPPLLALPNIIISSTTYSTDLLCLLYLL